MNVNSCILLINDDLICKFDLWYEKEEKHKILVGKPEGKRHLGDLCTDGRISK
jgi:hypothetical protein